MDRRICTLSVALCSCGTATKDNPEHRNTAEMEKKNIENLLTIYPKPMTIVGAEVDKSGEFDYHWETNGSPVIDTSPLTMECDMVDLYETEGFDSFICSVANIYIGPDVLEINGKPDHIHVKPVLFIFSGYSYLAMGELIGKCLKLDKIPAILAKLPMTSDDIVHLSKIEVYPEHFEEYMRYASEVGKVSLRTEPCMLTLYAGGEKGNPCIITILETDASQSAYKSHIASAHFQKYNQGTLHMVRSLVLSDQTPLNPANRTITSFNKLNDHE